MPRVFLLEVEDGTHASCVRVRAAEKTLSGNVIRFGPSNENLIMHPRHTSISATAARLGGIHNTCLSVIYFWIPLQTWMISTS